MFRRLRRDIIESVKGSDKDYTTIPIGKALLLLAIPMILEMVMESIFAIVDIFFVSKLGEDAVATVGMTESMMSIIYAISIGLSTGTVAMVSRRIGEKKPDEASKSAAQSIIAAFILSIILAVPGLFFAKDLLFAMGATKSMVETGYMYPTITMSLNGIIIFLFINNAIFRSSGDASRSMRVLWLANGINLILDPCLIFGLGPFPELGVGGAAIATAIGRGTAVVYQFYLLFNRNGRIKMKLSHFVFEISTMLRLLKLSAGGVLQSIIATTSWIGMVRIVAVFGSDVIAGYTIAIRIVIFSILPAWGLGNASATLVGQNLGANRPDRAEKTVWMAAFVNSAFMGIMALLFIIFSSSLVGIFMENQRTVELGARALQIICYGYISFAFAMVMSQSFNGAGDTRTPTLINFICFWILEIPLAYLLAMHTGLNEEGVYYSIFIAESCMALIGVILFKRGKWKSKVV